MDGAGRGGRSGGSAVAVVVLVLVEVVVVVVVGWWWWRGRVGEVTFFVRMIASIPTGLVRRSA